MTRPKFSALKTKVDSSCGTVVTVVVMQGRADRG